MVTLKDILPPVKSASSSFYDHSNDPWFKDRYTASATDGTRPPSTSAAAKPNPVPPYGKRSSFVPRKPDDFDDGGAFPEKHVAQYPIGMGRPNDKGGSKILPLTIDAQGKVRFDAVVRQNDNASKVVYSQHGDLIPKVAAGGEGGQEEEQEEEMEKEIEEMTQRTKVALERRS